MNQQVYQRDVRVNCAGVTLPGTLTRPEECLGAVIFVHGSGSGRLSPRNVAVADALVDRGCATLLFDLLTEEEASDRANVFDIALLSHRVAEATHWLMRREELRGLPIGYFGASTGAAAAIVAAGELGDRIAAVVSRGGRPDLAEHGLERIAAPTLLIVGSLDTEVIELNRMAQQRMSSETNLTIIDGASHLFEEPGTLEQVAALAGDWFASSFAARTRLGARS